MGEGASLQFRITVIYSLLNYRSTPGSVNARSRI
nr:MAG TPA: hypothetical protein [Caudoviricetes sp.]